MLQFMINRTTKSSEDNGTVVQDVLAVWYSSTRHRVSCIIHVYLDIDDFWLMTFDCHQSDVLVQEVLLAEFWRPSHFENQSNNIGMVSWPMIYMLFDITMILQMMLTTITYSCTGTGLGLESWDSLLWTRGCSSKIKTHAADSSSICSAKYTPPNSINLKATLNSGNY